MDARLTTIQKEQDQLFQRLAELQVEQLHLEGVFDQVPHFSNLEGAAHQLGLAVSRAAQQRASREVAARSPATSHCPECGQESAVTTIKRTVMSLDGPIEILEPSCHCSACRRAFFPST